MAISNGGEGNGADTSPNPESTTEVESKPLSLREVAEQSWNEIEAEGDAEDALEAPPSDGPARDAQGRFVSRETQEIPGEQTPQAKQPPVPAPVVPETQRSQAPDPAAQSSQAPENWSEQDRAMFAKLPREGQEFLTRRYGEMERDYTQKSQANATAVQFTQSLAPVFTNEHVQRSLVDYQTGNPVHPVEAIRQWADMHVRAMSPDPNVRAGFARDIMQRLQLDPAAVFGLATTPDPAALTPEQLQDPALRHIADHVGRSLSEVNALRAELDTMKRQTIERANSESLRYAKQGIDAFADAVDERGQKLYPYFDEALPEMIELYRANPDRDLREAYNTAIWMSATVRAKIQAASQAATQRQQGNARAAAAARGNIRGRTTPVARGDQSQNPQGLRATIAAAADEVGFEG